MYQIYDSNALKKLFFKENREFKKKSIIEKCLVDSLYAYFMSLYFFQKKKKRITG